MSISLDQILVWQHLVVMGAAMAIIEALKASMAKLGMKKETSKVVHTILPWLPIVLCGVAGLIPGVIQVAAAPEAAEAAVDAVQTSQIGLRVVVGVMLGGLSGQTWKIIKTKLELLKGKVG